MTRLWRIGAAAATAALLGVLMLSAPACSERPDPTPATKADQVYTLRGQIAMLPDPAKPAADLQIHHEPIPDFVNKNGEVVGMNSMIMPFTPASSLSLSGYAVGDIVEFTFEVRWRKGPSSRVTSMRKLPAETKLDFGRAKSSG